MHFQFCILHFVRQHDKHNFPYELEDTMAFDAFYLSAVIEEIRQIGEARVEKIQMQ